MRSMRRFRVRRLVGMQYSFVYHAQEIEVPGKGWFNEKYDRDAFTGQVGKVVPLKLETQGIGHAKVISVEVADDGDYVRFTYEIVDLDPGQESRE